MEATKWPLGPMCVVAQHPSKGAVYLIECDRDLIGNDPKAACKWRSDPIDSIFTTPPLAERIAVRLRGAGIQAKAIECSEIS
jgi:hypothetical protein